MNGPLLAWYEEHARILARYTRELVLCYDNDPAGKNPPTGYWAS